VVGGRDLEPPGTHTRTILSLSALRNANVVCAPAGVMRNSLPGRQIGRGCKFGACEFMFGRHLFFTQVEGKKRLTFVCFCIALKKIFEVVIFYLVKAFIVHYIFSERSVWNFCWYNS
jgi:hypothetical protein